MKKLFVLGTALLLFTGAAFACEGKEKKDCGKDKKECSAKDNREPACIYAATGRAEVKACRSRVGADACGAGREGDSGNS